MKDKSEQLMFYISKSLIAIPILVILIALVLRGHDFFLGKQSVIQQPTPTVTAPTINTTGDQKVNINLEGPLVCDYNSSTATASGYIKNKKIYVEMDQAKVKSNYLLNGDCLYIWQKNVHTGEKICGLSTVVSMVDMLSSFNMLSVDSLFKMVPVQSTPFGSSSAMMSQAPEILKNCKAGDIDDKMFDIPKNILFKATSISPTPAK